MADKERNEDGATDEGTKAPPKGKRKLVIIAAIALLLIGAGGGGWFFFSGHGAAEQHAEAKAPKPPAFVEVPDILVNLAALPGERAQYLKLKVVLEVTDEPLVEKIKPTMPRLTDIFQTYLRELRVADLSGSAGLFRLKEELTKRVNAVVSPAHVDAVLFKEVVVQ